MKTLYVSDLDGTLLRSNETTSDYTNQTINELVEKGMTFSYATARSFHTSHKVTKGLNARIPLIIYNGTMVVDNKDGSFLLKNIKADIIVSFRLTFIRSSSGLRLCRNRHQKQTQLSN